MWHLTITHTTYCPCSQLKLQSGLPPALRSVVFPFGANLMNRAHWTCHWYTTNTLSWISHHTPTFSGWTFLSTMAPGRKAGPSKRDGSFLPFLGPPPTTKPTTSATPSSIPSNTGPPPQASTQSTTTKPKAKKSPKPSWSQSAGQPAATPQPWSRT